MSVGGNNMLSFDEFPPNLRLVDTQIEHMSLQELQNIFELAEKTLLPYEFKRYHRCFWTAVNRARANPSKTSLQNVVNHLEDYKRALGRQYSNQHNMRVLLKYNEVERDIQYLSTQYELQRKSRPYFLGPRYN